MHLQFTLPGINPVFKPELPVDGTRTDETICLWYGSCPALPYRVIPAAYSTSLGHPLHQAHNSSLIMIDPNDRNITSDLKVWTPNRVGAIQQSCATTTQKLRLVLAGGPLPCMRVSHVNFDPGRAQSELQVPCLTSKVNSRSSIRTAQAHSSSRCTSDALDCRCRIPLLLLRKMIDPALILERNLHTSSVVKGRLTICGICSDRVQTVLSLD